MKQRNAQKEIKFAYSGTQSTRNYSIVKERGKDHPIQFISANRTPKLSAKETTKTIKSPSANSSTKKRSRPVLSSPDSSTERRPNKRQVMENNTEVNTKNGGEVPVKLNPELEMLKKQLFAGFESMIEPLKKDIKQLQEDQKSDKSVLNVETVNRKVQRNEMKQKKIEDRLSMIEDQLLEKNLIFQGIYETEFEDITDIKGYVIRAISNTMPGDDLDEKRTNAKCTSIDQIERIGRYNPQRQQTCKSEVYRQI